MNFKFLQKKDYLILFGLIFVTLAVRILFIFDHYDIAWEPDSYQHIHSLNQTISNMPESLWSILGVWNKPLYTAIFSFGQLFIPDSIPPIVFVQCSNAVLSSIALLFLVLALRKTYGADNLVTAVTFLVCSFSFIFFRSSLTALTEISAMLMVSLSLYFFSREKLYLSCLAIGLSILGRHDLALVAAVHGLFVFYKFYKNHPPKLTFIKTSVAALCTTMPLMIWNFLGYLKTGKPLYVLQGDYNAANGFYGYGRWHHFFKVFGYHDKILCIFVLISLYVYFKKSYRNKDLFYLMSLSAFSVYFLVLSYLCAYGIFGLAGLPRYFVGVLPYAFVLVFIGIKSTFSFFKDKKQAYIMAAAIAASTLLIISPAYKEPEWIYGQYTAPKDYFPDFRLRKLVKLFESYKEIHTDRPEIRYYLRNEKNIGIKILSRKSLNAESALLVYSKHWSYIYSDLEPADFESKRLILELPSDIYLYSSD